MNRLLLTRATLVALLALLAGCGSGGASDDDDKPDVNGKVLITTTSPVSQTFHDTIQAWGTAVGDPHRASVISLGHGGQVIGAEVVAGQAMKRGQVLLHIAPDPVARNTYRQAQSALTLAGGELKRTEQMAAQHLATQSQLAAARKALDDAQAALDAQRALGGGDAEETINAPADGVVTALSVNLGDRFQADAGLLTFTPSHGLIARLGVQPEDGPRLKIGMPVQVQGVYGDATAFNGRIDMVGQAVDAQTHLLPLQVALPPEASSSLVAGAAVQANIDTASYTAWALPRDAVLHDDKGDYVFAADHDHAKRVDVSLKHPEGDTVGVDGALDGKMRIIVLGSYELDDGDAVREQQEPSK
ncbi:efflux RND transporter periplasmic adaptor subunit [Dyella caseinilytica]|uniref:Efflux RND transporter periplasmic adaptor subunit n=1 Tax=Dyella caseinilytica TaxID=1849581 RepID=A0ABX7GNG4_9GAMM|nr:efflux RND transporter periplasmic adaptor subunit [Dyella caseinilytica]QRN51967.1 efflux RND transporter periplasmic adaptor subunit [Dyella caseinilytica]GGA03983.1 secretion protein HylD [Dyella caseinilytica]